MSSPLPSPVRDEPPAPVRIVHLGLGAFHRAHQAWYTAQAAPEWGIAAFTGRSPEAARVLAAQDGLYTLIERSDDGDHHRLVRSVVAVHDGAETATLRELVSRREVAVITLTVTEKGYRLDSHGRIDAGDPDITADAAILRDAGAFSLRAAPAAIPDGALRTMPGRLLWALDGRRRARAGPVAVIPCDNLAANADAVRAALHGLARLGEAHDTSWIDACADFISTSVDRITPRITDADIAAVEAGCGYRDAAPVVTEPYSSWILAGEFRGPRPEWERAGAVFVDDVGPYEKRKLWMLNGAHSLLAYSGLLRGHRTVAEAIADPECAREVHELWDLDERALAAHPELCTADYRRALEDRFRNAAIEHSLRQIAADGSVKLSSRVVDVVRGERERGRDVTAGLNVIAAWTRFVLAELNEGRAVEDPASAIADAPSCADPVRALVALVSAELAEDDDAMVCIARLGGGVHGR